MEKILGIDTGTNSLGWAIVQRTDEGCRLLDRGVHIFQEGVGKENGKEKSEAAERTKHRSIRIGYYRLRLRKIRLLRILSDNGLCPPLAREVLSAWRLKKIYPKSGFFMEWLRTDDKEGKNPYADRHRCLHERLDLSGQAGRYTLGRALYHIAQRRGFLSNRKEQGGDDEGKVKEGIGELTRRMQEAGCAYLGDYFFGLYNRGEKIRRHYTARKEHYLAEFQAICGRQGLDKALADSLEKAIFHQRPLKSQKGLVGRCTLEPGKPKCPASHPCYEEYRMLCFLNNVKVRTPRDAALRPLNAEERAKAMPLFYRKSKPSFNFEDIAKKLAPKSMYGYYRESPEMPYLFNYPMDTSVPGCGVTAALMDIFGANWMDGVGEVYTLGAGKTRLQIANDVWHALFFYSDVDKLAEFACERLQLGEEDARKFSRIQLPSGYASLSLKAIGNILPHLRRGIVYSHAVFLGNLRAVLPACVWGVPEVREAAIDGLVREMDAYSPTTGQRTLEDCVKDYLGQRYGVADEALKKLYHPSMMETYPKVRPAADGSCRLGSPRVASVRNPMAMRSMFRLRKLVNRLLQEGKVDADTVVHVEFARELNDANRRKALADFDKENEAQKARARTDIAEMYLHETGKCIDPSDTDVLKFRLWEEQGRKCLYTGRSIGIADFIGPAPEFDIEHTIPQSVGGDSTRMNLTLCDSRFNREVKKTKLPSELSNHDEILPRIKEWKDRYEELERQIRRTRTNRAATKKEEKDKIIQKRHLLELRRDYWKGKYERFVMTDVPEGFSRRQGTDIGIISRYARLYLKSFFKQVYTVKGIATADFRKIWGIQEAYSKKERVNHVHHCIDAIVIACIGREEYGRLAQYYHGKEEHRWHGRQKPAFPKPWPSFVEDVKNVERDILVSHFTPDNMPKQGRRRVRQDGGRVLCKGDAARGALHEDTYYGAIERGDKIRYVRRIALSSLKETDVKNIVDDTVRGIIQAAIVQKGFKDAMAGPVWMNEEKRIPINKVRCYATQVTKPLHIRQHRDVSAKDYKRQYHVVNDGNYMLAIYIGRDRKGKEKRDFELVNMLQAADYYKASNEKQTADFRMVPFRSQRHDCPFAYALKKGTMVLLYENTPEEIWESTAQGLSRRLYKVTGMSSMTVAGNDYATIKLRHHEEARQAKDLKAKNGPYRQGEALRPAIAMYHTQIKALVEGYDFALNELGEIKWLRRHD